MRQLEAAGTCVCLSQKSVAIQGQSPTTTGSMSDREWERKMATEMEFGGSRTKEIGLRDDDKLGGSQDMVEGELQGGERVWAGKD